MSEDTKTANEQGDQGQETASEAQEAVGKLLRETRERAGLDVADVARVLRISQRYLEALEDGRNADLPGPTYAIGFVRSYAEHLELDGEEIVRRYKSQAEGVGKKTDLIFPKPIPDSGVPGGAVLGIGVIVAAIAYGVWYYNSTQDDVAIQRVEPVPERLAANEETPPEPVEGSPTQEGDAEADGAASDAAQPAGEPAGQPGASPAETVKAEAQAQAPAVQEVEKTVQDTSQDVAAAAPEAASKVETAPAPAGPAVETPQETPSEAAEAVASAQAEPGASSDASEVQAASEASSAAGDEAAPVADGPSRITIRATSNSWIQVRDVALDRLLFTRLLRAGDEYQVPGRPGLQLMTGNAGALEILVDGEPVPSIGAAREVKRDIELDPEALKGGDTAGQ